MDIRGHRVDTLHTREGFRMDTKTVKLVEDVCSMYEDNPEGCCKALESMIAESPNPLQPP